MWSVQMRSESLEAPQRKSGDIPRPAPACVYPPHTAELPGRRAASVKTVETGD